MRILIIDDEAQIRRLLEITFAGRGWEVFTASTGFEGMQSVRGSKPDVVLLDLNLPDNIRRVASGEMVGTLISGGDPA